MKKKENVNNSNYITTSVTKEHKAEDEFTFIPNAMYGFKARIFICGEEHSTDYITSLQTPNMCFQTEAEIEQYKSLALAMQQFTSRRM